MTLGCSNSGRLPLCEEEACSEFEQLVGSGASVSIEAPGPLAVTKGLYHHERYVP